MLLTFLVGVWGADLFVSVISHLFILGVVNSETHSGSRYYSYGQMGSLQPPSYPHQLHSHVKPRYSALTRESPPHLGWLPAPHAGPARVSKSTPDECSPTSSQPDFPRIIYIFSLAAISSPLPTHFIRPHIAVL